MITETKATPDMIFTVMRCEVEAVWVVAVTLPEEEVDDASDFFLLLRFVGEENDKSMSRDLMPTSIASLSCKVWYKLSDQSL